MPTSWSERGSSRRLWPRRNGRWSWTPFRLRDGRGSPTKPFGPALADSQAQAAVALQPDVMLPVGIRARALLLSDQAQECLDLDLGPHAGIRAMCLFTVGRVQEAAGIVDSLRVAVSSGEFPDPEFTPVIPAGDLAAYYAWTGDPEQALPWIERVFSLSPSGIDPRVLESGLFDHLFQERSHRGLVEQIRDRVWERVQREAAQSRLEG